MGPLIALDTEVSLIGAHDGNFPIVDYIQKRELRKGTLITDVRFKSDKWMSYYYRATRTLFDYSAFNITILHKRLDNIIDDIRIVIVGNRKKFTRLNKIEDKLKNMDINNIDISDVLKSIDFEFSAKKLGSANYIKHLANIELERGLSRILWD